MVIAIHFARLGPYHLARLRSACDVLIPMGWRVLALEIAGTDSTYEWEKEPVVSPGYERVTVFPDSVFETRRSSPKTSKKKPSVEPKAAPAASIGKPAAKSTTTKPASKFAAVTKKAAKPMSLEI